MDKGELIRCRSAEECIHKLCELKKRGINTDFVFEHDGEKVFWLEVTGRDFSWLDDDEKR